MAAAVSTTNANKFFGSPVREYIYEDDQCAVYDEMANPQALEHFVVVPKSRVPRLFQAKEEDEKILGHMLLVVKNMALSKGLQKPGYHVIVDEDHRNDRLKAIHVFGRALQHMLWPTGPGARL